MTAAFRCPVTGMTLPAPPAVFTRSAFERLAPGCAEAAVWELAVLVIDDCLTGRYRSAAVRCQDMSDRLEAWADTLDRLSEVALEEMVA